MSKIIFLDLDGVLADFVSSALRALGREIDLNQRVEYSIENWFGISSREFWETIDSFGEEFWSEMELYPWAKDMVKRLEKTADTYILSSPSRNPVSSSGKVAWVRKHFPSLRSKIILTKHKHLLSSAGRFLIDDSEHKINPFVKAGGGGFLFPQPWNSAFVPNLMAEERIKLTLNSSKSYLGNII